MLYRLRGSSPTWVNRRGSSDDDDDGEEKKSVFCSLLQAAKNKEFSFGR